MSDKEKNYAGCEFLSECGKFCNSTSFEKYPTSIRKDSYIFCELNPNCYYKQLQASQQEVEALKMNGGCSRNLYGDMCNVKCDKCIRKTPQELYDENTALQQRISELKTSFENERQNLHTKNKLLTNDKVEALQQKLYALQLNFDDVIEGFKLFGFDDVLELWELGEMGFDSHFRLLKVISDKKDQKLKVAEDALIKIAPDKKDVVCKRDCTACNCTNSCAYFIAKQALEQIKTNTESIVVKGED